MIAAYRDSVMATDSGTYTDGLMTRLSKNIIKVSGGGLAVANARPAVCSRFAAWINLPLTHDNDMPILDVRDLDFEAILVNPAGIIFTVGEFGIVTPLEAPFVAIGCGWKVAFGAMAAGVSAERAVEIAIEFHDGCHAPVQTARLNDHA